MNIAILGYGIVGGGVHALLTDGALGIRVKRVLDVRSIEGLDDLLTDNIADILGDPDIHCIVETIGGMHPALSYVTSALRSGKHVVTSNKELVSHGMAPLMEGAAMHGVQIRFGASVGGGIPWIAGIARQRRADRIQAISGIANGTTNFILDAMAHGAQFADALAQAQRLGYAEADASADLDGLDAQRKCAVSAAMAFDAVLETRDIPPLGISSIQRADMDAFASRGLVCKLMMHAARQDASLSAYVEPTLIGIDSLAAHVPTNHNYLCMDTVRAGRLGYFGQGAGRFPTAETVVQDLLDISAGVTYQARKAVPLPVQNDAVKHAYYVRTAVPGQFVAIRAEAWGAGILTQTVSVERMHDLARQARIEDPGVFIAGVQG